MRSKRRRQRKKYLDSSVKKLFILAIVKGIPETRQNVKAILDALKLENVKFNFFIATDLKLQNILLGIQSGSSSFPCGYCESQRPFGVKALMRTLDRIRQLAKEFGDKGGILKDAKEFKNAIHDPLLSGDGSQHIWHLLPIPELHLFIGIGRWKLSSIT